MINKLRKYGLLFLVCLIVLGCGKIDEIPEIPIVNEKPNEKPEEIKTDFFIPANCSNAPKNISFNDGFKCKGSETRNETIVCVLPYQFTWLPFKDNNDGKNIFRCNKNDEHFDDVKIFLKNGNVIDLNYAGCHNPVFLADGKTGRQHFRNESIKWHDIKRRVESIRMSKNNKDTCLKF